MRFTYDIAEKTVRIAISSVYVDNQENALWFYTEILGFVKKKDVLIDNYRWLTVVSPEDPNGTELLLEPSDNPASRDLKKALFDQGIPLTSFSVNDIQAEYDRLSKPGALFTLKPILAGQATIAIFEDTCGNLIQIMQS